jgi:NADPH-dependent 2,4-dienoyl-CoA reductase/sulfur reductase-like enzyme
MRRLGFDVLVVGAGPAGLAAAGSAARNGAGVGLIDDNPTTGGQIWRGGTRTAHSAEARRWLDRASAGNVRVLTRTRVIAPLEQNALIAEAASDAVEVRFARLILAPGARERFLPFPGWTLPGIMGAGGLQALVKGGLSIAGKRVVVAGSGPLLLAVAAYLRAKGARLSLIAEQAPRHRVAAFVLHLLRDRDKRGQATDLGWTLRGVPFRTSCWVVRAHGDDRLEAVTVRLGNGTRTVACEYLACGFGLVPNLELPALFGCTVAGGAACVDEWQESSRAGVYCAGEVTGVAGVASALVEGQIAGYAATGRWDDARARFPARERARRFARVLDRAFALREELTSLPEADTFVCRCEDVTYCDVQQHVNWRSAKLHTRCGMGPCQGRVCGAATAFLLGWTQDAVRPPLTAAALGSLAQIGDVPIDSKEVAR